MAEKTPRDAQKEEQQRQSTPGSAAGADAAPLQQRPQQQQEEARDAAEPETTPQAALNESKEQGTGGAYVAPGGGGEAQEGAASQVFEIAVLPLQQTTMFPGTVIPLAAGRPRSVAAVEASLSTEEKLLACVTVREGRASESEATPPADLYEAGTLVMVKRMMRVPEGLQLIVHGTERIRVVKWTQTDPHLRARVRILPAPAVRDSGVVEALTRNVQALVQRALAMLPEIPPEVRTAVLSATDPVQLSYFLGSILNLGTEQEQQMLEAETVDDLLQIAYGRLAHEIEIMELRTKIAAEAQGEMTKAQRDYFLRQQMKAIQKELGEDEEGGERAEAEMLRERLGAADIPEEVRKEADRELRRLERLPQAAPDYHVIRTWLEFIIELPWNKSSEDKLDLNEARRILDEDHYGLEDIKERILEFLAVVKLRRDSKSPILCFVGPPGVGKTSLGMSIARALGRQFERLSLGGVRDEAELRGHRRTYIGAMPGRIIQALRRSGVNNPVMMLDEIDKLGADFRGDPASALLEILDPQQNHTFRDHYLDLPFDLSKVFFIATANQLAPIPSPLRDRMEIVGLAGYSDQEKMHIARQYLIPRQSRENGLAEGQLEITDAALALVAARYTREAGVRQLERTVGRVARKAALRIAQGEAERVRVDAGDVKELLGAPRFYPEEARKELPTGVATGMAWTETGGQLLFIEATLLPGSSGLQLTGQLGEVMQESARAARSYLWSHAAEFGLDPQMFKNYGVHVHVPAGAIPKDGPSAGVAITSSFASLMTGRRVRNDTAMTGEITLSGLVFPVGGIKEKVLAAHRAGLRRVVLPARNEPDAEEIPEDVRKELEIVYVSRIGEALEQTLETIVAQPPPPADPQAEEARAAQQQRQQQPTEPEPVRARGR